MQIKSIHITTYQQSTWGRVYVCFEKDNQTFYAFKNFLEFKELNYIGDGNIENEPAFTWFEQNKQFSFSLEEVLSGNADHLFLTPDKSKPVKFYSGITHCIPEDYRTSASRGHEIIYNIDAKNTKNCEEIKNE